MRNIIVAVAFFMSLALFLQAEEKPLRPEVVVEEFYTFLLSGRSPEEGPQIFHNPERIIGVKAFREIRDRVPYKDNAQAIMWNYIIRNKKLFLFDSIPPDELWERVRIGYVFSGFPRDGIFINGRIAVQVKLPIDKHNAILKQIEFPVEIVQVNYTKSYRIDFSNILINGIYIDAGMEHDRTGEFYEKLGFEQSE